MGDLHPNGALNLNISILSKGLMIVQNRAETCYLQNKHKLRVVCEWP